MKKLNKIAASLMAAAITTISLSSISANAYGPSHYFYAGSASVLAGANRENVHTFTATTYSTNAAVGEKDAYIIAYTASGVNRAQFRQSFTIKAFAQAQDNNITFVRGNTHHQAVNKYSGDRGIYAFSF